MTDQPETTALAAFETFLREELSLPRFREAQAHLAVIQRALRAAAPPQEPDIELIREDEAVRDAFVDCYTVQGIVTEERKNVVSSDDLREWDRMETILIRAILHRAVQFGAVDRLSSGESTPT